MATVANFDTQKVRALGGSDLAVGTTTIAFMVAQMFFSMLSSLKPFRRHGARVWIPVCMLSITLYRFLSPLTATIWQIYALQSLTGFFAGVITSFAISEGAREPARSMPPLS